MASAVVDGYILIVMEYLSGGSLHDMLTNFTIGTIPHSSIQRYVRDIIRGLEFLYVQHKNKERGYSPPTEVIEQINEKTFPLLPVRVTVSPPLIVMRHHSTAFFDPNPPLSTGTAETSSTAT